MSLFDAIGTASNAMNVHRFRSEVAAENLANVYSTPNYRRKVVDLQESSFGAELRSARAETGAASTGALEDARAGGVQIAGVRREGPMDQRQQAYLSTLDMMRSKSAYDLNVRAASMLKSMMLSSLEIGRGG